MWQNKVSVRLMILGRSLPPMLHVDSPLPAPTPGEQLFQLEFETLYKVLVKCKVDFST